MLNMVDPFTFDVHRNEDSLDIVLSSTMAYIDKADTLVKKLLKDHGLERHSFAVRVVMREGLTNSVRHAHSHDPEKLIRFKLSIENDKLIMTIEDQGEGFDWRQILSKATRETAEGSLKDHGRGVLIMDDYFDTWAYNEKGNVLTLEKNISS
jgi:serine/threonine-protein kinase RsbW